MVRPNADQIFGCKRGAGRVRRWGAAHFGFAHLLVVIDLPCSKLGSVRDSDGSVLTSENLGGHNDRDELYSAGLSLSIGLLLNLADTLSVAQIPHRLFRKICASATRLGPRRCGRSWRSVK
jgi:hypothetical protein